MQNNKVILENNRLQAKVLLPDTYTGSRYDWSGIIEQVTLDGKHTFLSREKIGETNGLGGIGLCGVFEWDTTELYDQTAFADCFPMMGIGLLRKIDVSPFLFTKAFPVIPFERAIHQTENSITIETLPQLCCGTAFHQTKTININDNCLSITNTLRNVGERRISGTEFCHNFFKFNDNPIDSNYNLALSHPIKATLRRGEIFLKAQSYRLGVFDAPTNSTAFWIEGYEGLTEHWMKLKNDKTNTSVLIETHAPIYRFYGWNNSEAFCPEAFVHILLEVGEQYTFKRKYTFSSEN